MKRTLGILCGLIFTGTVSAGTIGIGNSAFYSNTLENNLVNQGHSVTTYDSYDATTLSGLDTYIQDGNGFFDAALVDDFVFNGGTLIQLPWTFTLNGSLFSPSPYTAETTVMGSADFFGTGGFEVAIENPGINTLDQSSWLLEDVDLPAAYEETIGYEVGNLFDMDASEVLEWENGAALLGFKEYGAGMVIGFNVNLIANDSSPLDADWANQIIYNAVNGPIDVPEPESIVLIGLGLVGLRFSRKRV